jgi:hypothetical protein
METLVLIFLQSSKHACCLSVLMNEWMDTYKLLATLQDSDSSPMYASCCSEIATSWSVRNLNLVDHSKQTSGLSFIVLFTSWSLLADWFLLYCKLAGGFFLFLHHFLGAESHGALCVFQTKLVVSFLTFPKFLAIPMRGVVIIWISLLSASARLLVFHQ